MEKPTFLKTHSQDESGLDNVNINSIITFKENSNGYNTSVKIEGSDWITLTISYEEFKKLVTLK